MLKGDLIGTRDGEIQNQIHWVRSHRSAIWAMQSYSYHTFNMWEHLFFSKYILNFGIIPVLTRRYLESISANDTRWKQRQWLSLFLLGQLPCYVGLSSGFLGTSGCWDLNPNWHLQNFFAWINFKNITEWLSSPTLPSSPTKFI